MRRTRRQRSLAESLVDLSVFLVIAVLLAVVLRAAGFLSIETGPVRVIDGDSLIRGGTEIRLYGIDAPEYRQTCRDARGMDWPCGRAAAEALRRMIGGEDVACRPMDRDRYGRVVSLCEARGRSLNREMVRRGLALADRRRGAAFADVQAEARRARRGLWQGAFDPPEEWRRQHRSSLACASLPDCFE
jgi:endonuclease YncB( thermonuclease family)